MFVSINPTYFCNFRCSFCYLTKDQLSNREQLDLNKLDNLLHDLYHHSHIEHIDLYGGEIGTLKESYLNQLHDVTNQYFQGNINVITNLSHIHPYMMRKDVDLSVSFDFDCREKSDVVLKNIALVNKPIHLLVLASECLINKDVDEMISTLNAFNNIQTVEIKPYSTNQANCHGVSFNDFETFVKKWITSSINKRFTFINELNIQQAILGNINSFSDNHVYITPRGRYGVLEFDLNDNEYFLELSTLYQYYQWAKKEKQRVQSNQFCNSCPYFGKCLSEHLRDVKSLDNSCNGFKLLLDWYNERMENSTTTIS